MTELKNRAPIVDGIFYPMEMEKLRTQVADLLSQSKHSRKSPRAILVPHAGYLYTGKLAAMGFSSCADLKIKNVAILSPITRDAADGIFLSDFDTFETPLGKVEVAKEKVQKILDCKGRISIDNFPFTEEHSIEVQLPFIQILFPDAKIVPIHVGRQNSGTIKQLSNALKSAFAQEMESTLFVVSGNLSPYTAASVASKYADNLLALIRNGDYASMLKALQDRELLPNCAGCLIAVIGALDARPNVEILGTSDSGGDKIVCYGAASVSL